MSYPPPEGYPPTPAPPQHNATQPTVGIPAQPSPAPTPGYPPALAQISGTPYAAPEARRRPTVNVLAIAAAVLLVFSGLMLALFLNDHGNLNDTKADLHDTRADLTAQVQEQKALVAEQQEKLTQAEKRATDLNTELGTTKTNLADMTAQRNALVPCMRRIQDTFDAAANGEVSAVRSALRQARTSCDKAEIKVDS